MRALVVGASGQVGGALVAALGSGAVGTYRSRERPGLVPLDAADRESVTEVLRRVRPDVILFPAAEPNVDWCESHPDEARALNVTPLEVTLAEARGIPVVGFSSDYVFDGKSGPYGEDAERDPLSAYGRIKVEVEDLLFSAGHTVVRTTTVFGPEPDPPKNFVLRLIASLRAGQQVRIPSDQVATPTYSPDLATAVVRIAGDGRGLWHVAGPDVISRTELAFEVCEVFGLRRDLLVPTPTAELAQIAARPLRAGLLTTRYERSFGARPVRTMREALADLRQRLGASA